MSRKIRTFTGKLVDPYALSVGEIDIKDIAHSLAMQCRFGGHTRIFYSVAEHSVRVSQLLSPAHALWGLLHDASEAYLVDIPSPVKHTEEFEPYRELERMAMSVVAESFALKPSDEPGAVKVADTIMLRTEQRDLMGRTPKPTDGVRPVSVPIVPWPWAMAEGFFLDWFRYLMKGAV